LPLPLSCPTCWPTCSTAGWTLASGSQTRSSDVAQTMDSAIELARPSASQQAVASVQDFFSAMRRNRAGFIRLLPLSAIILIPLIGPFLVPQTLPTDVHAIYQPPSSRHLLGTDSEGRDVLIQVIAGGQSIILVGFMAAGISTLISITFGALAAYVGGFVDSVV